MKCSQFLLSLSIYCSFFLLSVEIYGQKPLNPTPAAPNSQNLVEILNSDIQEGVNLSNLQISTFIGHVIFRHQGVLMGTDKAINNTTQNTVEAFGNIRINQGDTLTIVGDSLFYEGNGRIATIWGKSVILRDKKVTLRTRKIIYDMASGIAYYPVRGEIVQDSSKLSSNTGTYNTKTKYFNYVGDVEVFNPKFLLCTHEMDYDTYSKRAIFKAFTTVSGENGTLTAQGGWYNINSRESYFEGRPTVINEKYSLTGDTLSFDSQKDNGWAKGNVVFVSKTDSLIVVGDEAKRSGGNGITEILGNTISKMWSDNDTTLMASAKLTVFEVVKDSINKDSSEISANSTLNNKDLKKDASEPSREDINLIIAVGKVQTFNKDLQSISDSLVYNAKDSLIGYYKEPVLWQKKNQTKADTIHIFLSNNKISRMDLLRNCFIIQEDTLNNFNQIKGRIIQTFFTDSSKLERIEINGNAETKYFVLDDNQKIVGLETAESSTMKFLFKHGELHDIKFFTDVDAVLIPAKQITVSEAKFEDFNYRINEKPSAEKIYALKHGSLLSQTKLE